MVSRFLGRTVGLAHCQRRGHLRPPGWGGSLESLSSLFLRAVARALRFHRGVFFFTRKTKNKERRGKSGKRGSSRWPSLSSPPFSFTFSLASPFRDAWRGTRRHYSSTSSSVKPGRRRERKFTVRSLRCISGNSSPHSVCPPKGSKDRSRSRQKAMIFFEHIPVRGSRARAA